MTPTDIILLSVVAAGLLAALVVFIIKICKMSPDERKEVIITFLIGLVTNAETALDNGEERFAWVEEQFSTKAPMFYKLLLMVTKSANLDDLIEKALERAKATVFDQKKENK